MLIKEQSRLGKVSVRKNIVANYLSRGWSAAMGLAFIPLYTRMMGVEAMGVVGLFVTMQALCMLLDAGLSTTLNREMARMSQVEGSGQEMRNLLRTFELPFWVAAFAGGLIVFCLAPFIAHRWVHVQTLTPESVEFAIRLMGAVLFFQLPMSLYAGGLLGIQRQVEYGVLNATWYTLRFAGAAVALKVAGPTLASFFYWQVLVSIAATTLSAIVLGRLLPPTGERARFKPEMLQSRWRFAAGLGGISVTLLLLNNVDKVVLSRLVTLHAFGYYTLAWTLANAVRLLADPMFVSVFPKLSQAWAADASGELARIYHRACQLMSLAILPFGLTLAIFSREAMLVWTRSPDVANQTSQLLQLLAFGNVCLGLTVMPYALQLASGWTSLALWANTLAALFLIPLMSLLGYRYGLTGGGIAWLTLNSVYLLGTVAIMHRRLLKGQMLRWAANDIGRSLAAVAGVLAIARVFGPNSQTPSGCLVVIGVVFMLSLLSAFAASPLFTRAVYKAGATRLKEDLPDDGPPIPSFKGKRVCFFVKTSDPTILDRNEFYRIDIQILEELGFEVVVCTSLLRIPTADVYFVWWWTWAFVPLLRAKLTGKRTVVVGTFDHVMPGNVFQIYPHRRSIHRALIRWALKNAEANVVSAEDQSELMRQTFSVNNLEVSPHVLATDLYCPAIAKKEPFFVTVCWMHEDNAIRKCVATSIRAIALLRKRLPNYKLIVAGDKGLGYPPLAQLVTELDAWDLVEFPGVVTTEDKISLMQRCSAYVQPTLAEGFGVAILESMSCGAPVVVSPVGGVPGVVGDCALFVDGHDAQGLADALFRIVTEAETAADLSARGRSRAVEKFSYRRRFGDFGRVLTKAMK